MRPKNRIQVMVLVMFLFCISVFSYAEVVKKVIVHKGVITETFYNNDKIIAQIATEASGKVIKKRGILPDGVVKEYYKSGKLESEWNYKDWKEDAAGKRYYETGQLKSERNYKDGKLNGILKGYYKSGKLNLEANYKNDKSDGIIKIYYESGKLNVEENYKDGKRDGLSKEYSETGRLKSEWNYNDGKWNGVSKEYYETGQLKSERNYKDDKQVGIEKEYSESGKLITDEDYVVDSKMYVGLYLMYAKGGLVPKKKTLFQLGWVRVVQKAKDGYLVEVAAEEPSIYSDYGFLYTDKEFSENENLTYLESYAYYVGNYTYQAMNGYTRTILAFKLSKRN